MLAVGSMSAASMGRAMNRAAPDRVAIRADRVLGTVSSRLFGQTYSTGTNISPPYVAMYRQLSIGLLAAPGGKEGDEADLSQKQVDDLAALARTLNAPVALRARLGRAGTPEKAASLVRYANVERGYGFRYWEIGAEPDLYPTPDVDWYNVQFRDFALAMKAVDPGIQVAGPVVSDRWMEWLPAFIATNGDIVDVLSWRWYPPGDKLTEAQLLATPAQIERQVSIIREWWRTPRSNPKAHLQPVPPLFLSAYAASREAGAQSPLGSEAGALWVAEVLGRLGNIGVELASYPALQGAGWLGLIGDDLTPRPTYGIYRLYREWGQMQLAVESPDEALLPAFASRRSDGALAVLALNKDPQQARPVELAFTGFRPAGQAEVWQQDAARPAGEKMEALRFDGLLSVTLPPYSATLFILPAARPVVWPLWVGLFLGVAIAFGIMIELDERRANQKLRHAKLIERIS
jgi:hypothetical protein